MRGLNRSQKVAALAAIAFVFWAVGNSLHVVLFDSGIIVYSPASIGTDWTLIWHEAVQAGIWLVLAVGWLGIAIRTLRSEVEPPE